MNTLSGPDACEHRFKQTGNQCGYGRAHHYPPGAVGFEAPAAPEPHEYLHPWERRARWAATHTIQIRSDVHGFWDVVDLEIDASDLREAVRLDEEYRRSQVIPPPTTLDAEVAVSGGEDRCASWVAYAGQGIVRCAFITHHEGAHTAATGRVTWEHDYEALPEDDRELGGRHH